MNLKNKLYLIIEIEVVIYKRSTKYIHIFLIKKKLNTHIVFGDS